MNLGCFKWLFTTLVSNVLSKGQSGIFTISSVEFVSL